MSLNGSPYNGQQAVTNTAVALPAVQFKFVTLKAAAKNNQPLYIGNANVTVPTGASPGYELQPGESVPFWVINISSIYVIAASAGATIEWIGVAGH